MKSCDSVESLLVEFERDPSAVLKSRWMGGGAENIESHGQFEGAQIHRMQLGTCEQPPTVWTDCSDAGLELQLCCIYGECDDGDEYSDHDARGMDPSRTRAAHAEVQTRRKAQGAAFNTVCQVAQLYISLNLKHCILILKYLQPPRFAELGGCYPASNYHLQRPSRGHFHRCDSVMNRTDPPRSPPRDRDFKPATVARRLAA
jgi:hypothetical protein